MKISCPSCAPKEKAKDRKAEEEEEKEANSSEIVGTVRRRATAKTPARNTQETSREACGLQRDVIPSPGHKARAEEAKGTKEEAKAVAEKGKVAGTRV